jgi:RNA polymerase primary sigma factor
MAVTKIAPVVVPSARKNRVARVTAKRPKQEKESTEEPDVDFDDDEEVAEKPSRPDGGTYLSMYFKDMAMLDVLRPEEEFTSAREIEALEIMLWEVVLAHAPAVGRILDAVAEVPDFVMPVEAKTLRRFAEGRDAKAFARASARAARKLRAADSDHLFIEAALGTIDRLTLGIGIRGGEVASLGSRAKVNEWMRRVQQANRAAADARNAFVKANLRLVVSIARSGQPHAP